MQREEIIYAVYAIFFLLVTASIVATPLLAESTDMTAVYNAYSYTCHQKLSRSLCTFDDGQSRWIADCLPQEGEYLTEPEERLAVRVKSGDAIGYKMPVCSRDFGLYAALLMGALVYPIVRELKDRRVPPPVFFLLALVPIALDGGLQLGTILLSSMGTIDFVYESTNVLRLITGVIAGFAASFYAIPLLMNMFGGPRSR